MSNVGVIKIRDGNDPADKELYRIKIEFERNGYNGIGEKIPKQKNGPFKKYLNTLKNPRTKNWKIFGKIHGDSHQGMPFTPFSRDEAIYILENRDPKNIRIMFPYNQPITLEEMSTNNYVVYNEVLKYIWNIHHMKVKVWKNEENRYTVEDSDTVVDKNTHFSIDPPGVVNIDNDNATVIDDEMYGDDEMDGGKRRKTKSRKSKKSSPKRKRRTNRRR